MEIGFITFLIIVVLQGFIISFALGPYLRKKGWEIYGPAQMWKSKKGLGVVDKIAKLAPRFWRAYGSFGIILGFGFLGGLYVFRNRSLLERIVLSGLASLFTLSPIVSSVFLGNFQLTPAMAPAYLAFFIGYGPSLGIIAFWSGIDTLMRIFASQPVVAKAGPVIPGVNIRGSPFQNVPWYGWLVFPLLLGVHELSHGILARLGKIRLKSAGVILAGLLPLGAFVEPDDAKLKKSKHEKTLPIFAAGSVGNYVTAFVFFFLLTAVITPVMDVSGISRAYESYLDYPKVVVSDNPSIPVGARIMAINNMETSNIGDIHKITSRLGPGSQVELKTDKGSITTKLNSQARLGVYLTQEYTNLPIPLSLLSSVLTFLGLIVFFNYVVGLMNLIPILPLDGGLMFKEFLWKFFGLGESVASKVSTVLSILLLVGLLLNILPLLLMGF